MKQQHLSFYKRAFFLIVCWAALTCAAQSYSFPILRSGEDYRDAIRKNPDNRLVELKSRVPGLAYDLQYATTNNFMHRQMYPRNTTTTFMREPAAEALAAIQKELNREGLGLKIFDAYRPFKVSEKFWELVKDERYVANPAKGSNHNRGTAVDLTLIDLKTGRELPMGTGFDNFTDTAHHSFTALPPQVLRNREQLKSIMQQHGFKSLDSEWWHYTYTTGTFDVLDLSFKQLSKYNK
ncbi:M15 family metallopeptidase [Niabella sp.]|uniref:M15 family metallopeptidase n=1 Tax=Niabella sp. TaxID=1962976 RepID=UPI002625EB7C|nr:M15 family metallopeptidase [Niabella sp.]